MADAPSTKPRVAAIVTAYYPRSHADVIASKLLADYTYPAPRTWDQFDFHRNVWVKPDHATKQKREHETPLSLGERESLITDVLHELFGLGPLEALLGDPSISDILVNRFNQVYIEREGRLEETDVVFRDDKHLLQIIERIVSAVGRRIDESSPMVEIGRAHV